MNNVDELAPVEVLCNTINLLHDAVTLGINLDQEQVREALDALLTIEAAMLEGRDFYKQKGER